MGKSPNLGDIMRVKFQIEDIDCWAEIPVTSNIFGESAVYPVVDSAEWKGLHNLFIPTVKCCSCSKKYEVNVPFATKTTRGFFMPHCPYCRCGGGEYMFRRIGEC